MSRFLIPVLAAVMATGASGTALAQKATTPKTNAASWDIVNKPPDRARRTTVKSSKSNTSDRMGGGGGGHPAGIAVSDPGAEGSKPTKKSNK